MNTNDYKLIEGKPYFSGDYVLKREQEIKRLKQKAQDDYENYQEIMSQVLEQKDRLNNILKALEKGIKENIAELEEHQLSKDRIDEDKNILRFLQELKGSDKE